MLVRKERSVLKFIIDDNNYGTYDLKDGATKKTTNGTTRNVNDLRTFFRGYSLNALEWEDEKYREFIRAVRRVNHRCSNIGTFLDRLREVQYFENYILLGIRYQQNIRHPSSIYSKDMLKIFAKYDIAVSVSLENLFVREINKAKKELYVKSLRFMDDNDFEVSDVRALASSFFDYRSHFFTISQDYSCDYKRVLDYMYKHLIVNEGMDAYRAWQLYSDYLRMQKAMAGDRDFDKYPRFLHSMHDIVSRNFQAFRETHDEEVFSNMVNKELEYHYRGFSIVIPKCTEDIKQEGVALRHCVGSYVNKIIRGETQIVFLRKTDDLETSVVTVQITNGAIVQARGTMNRSLLEDELAFLKTFASVKGLTVNRYY